MNNALQKLEAVLFTSGSAVAKKRLMKMIKCDDEQLEDLLQTLKENRGDSGVLIVDDGAYVALTTNPSLETFMEDMQEEDSTAPLSRAAQETLSIIAYAGPIAKVDLDFLRGVNTQYTLRRLTIRGLIQDEQKGQTRAIMATVDFLLHLGIQKIEDLPEYSDIRRAMLNGLRAIKQKTEEREL